MGKEGYTERNQKFWSCINREFYTQYNWRGPLSKHEMGRTFNALAIRQGVKNTFQRWVPTTLRKGHPRSCWLNQVKKDISQLAIHPGVERAFAFVIVFQDQQTMNHTPRWPVVILYITELKNLEQRSKTHIKVFWIPSTFVRIRKNKMVDFRARRVKHDFDKLQSWLETYGSV